MGNDAYVKICNMTKNKSHARRQLNLFALTMLIVGSVIGAGVFNMINEQAIGSSLVGIIGAWIIVAIGVGALVYCFYSLNRKRPDIDAGVYAYADKGFGRFMGFQSAWGYWISSWISDVAFATLLMSAIGYFVPIFHGGQNFASVIGASVILWVTTFLAMRGAKSGALVNAIVTAAKLIPIAIFLVCAIAAFNFGIFNSDIWSGALVGGRIDLAKLISQIGSALNNGGLLFVFIGIEGAVIYSDRARNRKDIGRSTAISFVAVLVLYFAMSIFSLGVMSAPSLAKLSQPGMASLLSQIIGPIGAFIVNLGIIISVAGAWLAWTMYCGELPMEAAKNGTFPKIFAKLNSRGAPSSALLITAVCTEIFIISWMIPGLGSAWQLMLALSVGAIVPPYLFTALFQFREALTNKYRFHEKVLALTAATLAIVFIVLVAICLGFAKIMGTIILLAFGSIIFVAMRFFGPKVRTREIASKGEIIAILLLGMIAIAGLIWMFYSGGFAQLLR